MSVKTYKNTEILNSKSRGEIEVIRRMVDVFSEMKETYGQVLTRTTVSIEVFGKMSEAEKVELVGWLSSPGSNPPGWLNKN